MMSRCYCIPDERYWDKRVRETKEPLDEYIKTCALRACTVAQKAQQINDPMERRKMLVRGLTSLHTLKDFDYKDAEQAKVDFQSKVPFKLQSCRYPFKCCGSCTVSCPFRCVQDVMHRYYVMCSSLYMGLIDINTVSTRTKLCLQQLMDPRITYDELANTISHLISTKYNKDLAKKIEEGVYDENPYMFSYEPIVEECVSPNGYRYKKADPNTGEFSIVHWPDSGLCPYCLPNVTAYDPGSTLVPNGRKRKREKLKTQKLLRERKQQR